VSVILRDPSKSITMENYW